MFEESRSTAPMAGEVAEATPRYAVVLSDVHIGNGLPTCWYQPGAHNDKLTAILNWIVARRASIREVVLLGDLFDVWTYAPSVQPPTMAQIITANRALLGPSGPFAALVRALPNRVRLLLGNHDSSLTRADIALLNASLGGNLARGERIELLDTAWHTIDGTSGRRTVFSHGHHWCMFNAPDTRSRWGAIPVGHFVSRAIAYQMSRSLRPGETTANRPNNGNPSIGAMAPAIISSGMRGDLAAQLLATMCMHTGMSQTERIVMPGGSATTVREAMGVFAGLFTLWVGREGRREDALRAAFADLRGTELSWFAQRLALRTASDLVVMGHTHEPIGGVVVSPVNYVNSGYECVALPDDPPKQFTFTQVDLEGASAQVFAVVRSGAGFTVVPARAPTMPTVITAPGTRDYSCYARIENHTDRPLRRVSASTSPASYTVVPPPLEIAPRSHGNVWVQDTLGVRGSACRFTYSDGARNLEFVVECPSIGANVVRSPVDYATKVGRSAWRRGGVDRSGYPMQARFFVGARRAAGVALAPATPPIRRPSRPAPSRELQHVVVARAILDRTGAPRDRGAVLGVARLVSGDGRPLLDPTTAGTRLAHPPNHLVRPDVESITMPDRTTHRFVWVQPTVRPGSRPLAGGIAFLAAAGDPSFTLVTFNVAPLGGRGHAHHAEMQLIGFVDAQPAAWRARLAKLELHLYSRTGPTWGYSACSACLGELAGFLTRLNGLARQGRVAARMSWERLCDRGAACGPPTDAASITRLVAAGWDEPQGSRPPGTQWPTAPTRQRALTP